MDFSGKFIVIDGPDGSGKGAQLDRLQAWIEGDGGACVRPRDPGGTDIGERIRAVLLNHDLTAMDPACEALLFMASRAQLASEVIRPALAAGQAVLCDRYISATCAYQVAAGYPLDDVLTLGRLAVGATWPDVTIILDVPAEIGFERIKQRAETVDAMERRPLEFHQRVGEAFRRLPDQYPAPVVVLDGQRPPDDVFADVQETLRRALG